MQGNKKKLLGGLWMFFLQYHRHMDQSWSGIRPLPAPLSVTMSLKLSCCEFKGPRPSRHSLRQPFLKSWSAHSPYTLEPIYPSLHRSHYSRIIINFLTLKLQTLSRTPSHQLPATDIYLQTPPCPSSTLSQRKPSSQLSSRPHQHSMSLTQHLQPHSPLPPLKVKVPSHKPFPRASSQPFAALSHHRLGPHSTSTLAVPSRVNNRHSRRRKTHW